MANLLININQVCSDLTNIKNAIQDKGIDIASGTPSSEYSSKIDEVYEAGKQELLELHPEVTVSGNYISLDDVSELPHEVKCKVSGVADPTGVTVTNCGRNLLNPNTLGSGEIVEYNGVLCYKYIDKNVDTGNWKITGCFKENTQYTITIKQYRLETASISNWQYVIAHTDGSSVYVKQTPSGESVTLTSTAGKTVAYIYSPSYGWDTLYLDLSVSCLNEGVAALPYEPYNGQTLTPNADGTVEGMTSVSPYMNIFTDTEGANLDATYRKSLGIQTEYDRFWDSYQLNGTRTSYMGAFGAGWNKENFKPKYIIKPSASNGAYGMFAYFGYGSSVIDYREIAHYFDWSTVGGQASMMFQDARIDYIDIDLSRCAALNSAFSEGWGSGKKTHLTIKISEKCTGLSGAFGYCTTLTHLFFADGSVIQTNIDLKDCPLIKESIESVINTLSPTVTGKTATFKKTAKEAAFTDEEWSELIATKPNWTISLV